MRPAIQIFHYKLFVKEFFTIFFCYLLAEQCFSWLFIQNASVTTIYVKVLSIGVFAFVLYDLKNYKIAEKVVIWVFLALMAKLVMQSLIQYGTPFKYFTIFTVLFPAVYVVFIKSLMRKLGLDLLELIANFYLVTYVLFMLIFGHQFSLGLSEIELNTGPFSGDTRIIHASSVLMINIPLLWYLNRFIKSPNIKSFLIVLFCLTVILLHQHRSVWSCTIFAGFLYFVLVCKNRINSIPGVTGIVVTSAIILVLSYFLISQYAPGMLGYFSDRFSEIFNPAKEGSTGNFRIEQSRMYMNFIAQKPFFGWSFEGFELPNPYVDWWEEGTGHHFHEGFIEILFYHGIAGLLLKYSFLIYITFKCFSKKLSDECLVLMPFCISGLLFSLNYVPTLIFWGHVGMCLFYLESYNSYRGTFISAKTDLPDDK